MLLRLLPVAFLTVACVAKDAPKSHDSQLAALESIIAEAYDSEAHVDSLKKLKPDLSKDQNQTLYRILSEHPHVTKEFKEALEKFGRTLPQALQVSSISTCGLF